MERMQSDIKELKTKIHQTNCLLRKKVPWVGAGVIVAVFTVVAFLTYEAYSGEQERQCAETAKNSEAVQELKTTTRVIAVQYEDIKDELQELKETQKDQFNAIMHKLDQHTKTRRESRGE